MATGELEIVGLDKEEGELGDAVQAVALVLVLDSGGVAILTFELQRLNSGGEGSIPPSRVDDWRQLIIPVDLPFLNVRAACLVGPIHGISHSRPVDPLCCQGQLCQQ